MDSKQASKQTLPTKNKHRNTSTTTLCVNSCQFIRDFTNGGLDNSERPTVSSTTNAESPDLRIEQYIHVTTHSSNWVMYEPCSVTLCSEALISAETDFHLSRNLTAAWLRTCWDTHLEYFRESFRATMWKRCVPFGAWTPPPPQALGNALSKVLWSNGISPRTEWQNWTSIACSVKNDTNVIPDGVDNLKVCSMYLLGYRRWTFLMLQPSLYDSLFAQVWL